MLLTLTALAMAVSTPSAAQQGRDPFVWEEPLQERTFVKAPVRGAIAHEGGTISLVEAAVSDPTVVVSAATTEYKYDDGTPEGFTNIRNAHDQEYAQRFRLPRAGTVASATACFGRPEDDGSANVSFVLTFYRDSGGRPGARLASYSARASGLDRGRWGCFTANRGAITQQRLGSGDTWLSVRWENSTGKSFAEDRNGPGGTRNFWRARSSSGASWSSWNRDTEVTAYFIRLGVDHGSGTPPPPDPDPEPPPTTGCRPTTTALQFDGGYKVSMCYRTPDGREGQAKSGVWASSQAGLLWFFDRENAEALVKVLNGCAHNGHRWVYVAPVTDLEFNLWVTGPNGQRWTHTNRQGRTASTKADTRAFQCSNEDDDDSGDDDGDDDDNDDGDGDDDGGGDVSDAMTARVTTCEGNQTAGSTWDTTIAGSVTANRSVRNVRVQGYIEPGRRQIGNQLLGSIAANQTRTFHMTGTVSGAAPTRCEVRVTGNTGAGVLRISAPMEREVREP